MEYNITYTAAARQDLEAIWDYISSEYQNDPSAERIVNSIMDAIDQLGSFPGLGPALDSIIDIKSDYRFLTTEKYLTFYRILGTDIRVERILYGSRDYLSCLFGGTSKS